MAWMALAPYWRLSVPVKSQAQRRWAFATAEGKTDAPPSVGKEFVEASHGIKNLPERAKPMRRDPPRKLLVKRK